MESSLKKHVCVFLFLPLVAASGAQSTTDAIKLANASGKDSGVWYLLANGTAQTDKVILSQQFLSRWRQIAQIVKH